MLSAKLENHLSVPKALVDLSMKWKVRLFFIGLNSCQFNTSLKYCIYESIQLKEYDIWEFILSRAGNSNMAKTYSVL